MKDTIENVIKSLAKKCEEYSGSAPQAVLHYSQAALNLANVLATLDHIKQRE